MINSGATLAQARTLHSQGHLAEAVSMYREVLAREPLSGDALHLMGLAVAALGDAQQALRLIGSAAQLQPSNAAVQANLATALSAVGRHAQALRCYERALALQPDLAAAHRGRGAALMNLGRPEAALRVSQRRCGWRPTTIRRATAWEWRSRLPTVARKLGNASIGRSRSTRPTPRRTTTWD